MAISASNGSFGDFERCGLVGEEVNKLTGYLAAVSRKLSEPLAVVVQSSSSAGKSALMEAVLELVPVEDRVVYSAMTGQSLFYMGEADLEHKILAIVEEEGAERASYALKLLQSEGELTIASTCSETSLSSCPMRGCARPVISRATRTARQLGPTARATACGTSTRRWHSPTRRSESNECV